MQHGAIVHYNYERGYGFIRPDENAPNVFVHATGFAERALVEKGTRVSFDTEISKRTGKLHAVSVRVES